jgi:glycosyltransferase involved in cell wall biosynthesis
MWADAIVLYQPGRGFVPFAALRRLTPMPRRPILAMVDAVFTAPGQGFRQWFVHRLQRWLLKSVDLFLLPQRDVERICAIFHLKNERFHFVPFKVNSFDRLPPAPEVREGYVFSGGKSRRDYATFCKAMAGLPYTAVIALPQQEEASRHGTGLRPEVVPPNVRVIRHDESNDTWIELIQNAEIVVLAIEPCSISASGVSVYLLAMALGRPVIITEGCATIGVLTDGKQALIVRQQDSAALARAIHRLMSDHDLRQSLAEGGRAYALSLGGEAEYVMRIAEAVAAASAAP